MNLVLVASFAASKAALPQSASLPPIACIEATRAARIASDRGDSALARQRLEAALDLPGCELAALTRLVSMLRDSADAPARFAELRDRLVGRLRDPAIEIPDGLLAQLTEAPAQPADDELLLDALAARRTATAAAAHAASTAAHAGAAQLAELLQAIGELELRLGRDAAARATFGQLLELAPNDRLRWRVLMVDVDRGDWQSAEALLVPMIADPEAPEMLRYLHATALAHLGRLDELLVLLDQLAPPPPTPRSSPSEPSYPTAELAAAQALSDALDPENSGGFAGLLLRTAWALRDAGRDADAATLFRRALIYAPDSAQAHGALLHLYGTDEERAEAAAAAENRRSQETDPQRLFEEGSDLLGAGDAAGARSLLARAAPELAGSTYAEPAWYNLGTANFKLERWAEAADAFAQALAVNPDRPEGLWKRAIALYHLERCSEAVPLLRAILERDPAKRDAHYYLSGCYVKLGDAAAAARESAIFNAKP